MARGSGGGAVVRGSGGTGSLEVNGTKSFAVFFIQNGNVFSRILMAKHLVRVQNSI